MVSELDSWVIAKRCNTAFSRDAYTTSGWQGSAKWLAGQGFDKYQIEWVLRSKWMRWAADVSSNSYGHNSSRDLIRFMESSPECTPDRVDSNIGSGASS